MTREQILALLGPARLRGVLAQHGFRTDVESLGADEGETSEEDDMTYAFGRQRRRRRRETASAPNHPPVPNPAGTELMDSGTFGINKNWQDTLRRRKKYMARILMTRELGMNREQATRANQEIAQDMKPPFTSDMIIHYKARCYSGQFSNDGNFFFSCAQDYKVRMYDTSNPYDWKYYRTVFHPYGQWTITDATLSPDNKFLACSTIRSTVCLAITDPTNEAEPYMLNFACLGGSSNSRRPFHSSAHFGVMLLLNLNMLDYADLENRYGR